MVLLLPVRERQARILTGCWEKVSRERPRDSVYHLPLRSGPPRSAAPGSSVIWVYRPSGLSVTWHQRQVDAAAHADESEESDASRCDPGDTSRLRGGSLGG